MDNYLAPENKNSIKRSIEFPPEYHQAGISILNYFGTVLRKKYPEAKAKVRIEQEDLKVTMIIDPEMGEREVIEKVLDEYGLVVTGKLTPKEFYNNNSLQIMELETQLSIARVHIENQKRVIEYQDRELKNKDKQTEKRDIQIDKLLEIIGAATKRPYPELPELMTGVKVFISYSENDEMIALKLYNDLKKTGAAPWIDSRNLLPGEKWRDGIHRAVRESSYFLVLLSKNSVSKRGYIHKEQEIALDILNQSPSDQIFVIPVRTEDCNPNHEKLQELKQVDLFPSYDKGLERIIHAISGRNRE